MRGIRIFMAVLGLAALLAGCTVGPDYKRPDLGVNLPEKYQHAGGVAAPEAEVFDDRWWEGFGDPKLNALVEEAVKNNLDLRQAAARVMEVGHLADQAWADRLPSFNLSGTGSRQNTSVDVAGPSTIKPGPGGTFMIVPGETRPVTVTAWSYDLSAAMSFELDFWGKYARTHEAARADLLQAEASRRTVAQSVIAETVSQYLQLVTLERRITLARKNIESARQMVEVVEGRYERGIGSTLAVRQARRAQAQAEASLPPIYQDLGAAQRSLGVLLGRYPKTSDPQEREAFTFDQLAPIPAGLPSDLLERRPDVRSAEAALMAASARIGVAKANRFPSFSLTGNFGFSSNEINELFWPENRIVGGGISLLAPLFNWGKLKAVQRAAEARYRQAEAEYIQTVLTALAEVEAALQNRKLLSKRRELLLRLAEEARATQEEAETRYLAGLSDFSDVLEARQTRYSADDGLVLAELALLSNRVGLHRVMGGGWDEAAVNKVEKNRPESE